MSSYVIKEKTGWQSCQAEQKYPERHDPAKMILTVCMCFLHVIKTACKFTSVYSWACCRPLPCSLAPILPFLLSQLSLPLRQISLCIICGCFLAGVWFVRLESWQSVFDHADPPLHGWAWLTAGRPTRGFNVGEMERQRSVTERCGSVKKKKMTDIHTERIKDDYKPQIWSNRNSLSHCMFFAHFLFQTSLLPSTERHTSTQGSDYVPIFILPIAAQTLLALGHLFQETNYSHWHKRERETRGWCCSLDVNPFK